MKLSRKIAVLVTFIGAVTLVVLFFRERDVLEWMRRSDTSGLRVRAQRGNANAQFDLGSAYFYGKRMSQNYAEAARWYKMAADQGEPRAEDALGYMNLKALGVPQDYAEALRWYKTAAEQGNAKAQFDLSSMYYYGTGVQQDYAEALHWSRKAADQNYAKAQDAVASMYYSGLGVQQDYPTALAWYRKAADHGYARAQFDLASMYYNGAGTARDYDEARRWYIKAAKQGNTEAQKALGLFGAESDTVTNLEYLQLLGGLGFGLWLLLGFLVHGRKALDWRQAALLVLAVALLANSAMSIYVIVYGGLRYCSYPIAFHIVRRLLLVTAVVITVAVVLPAKRKLNAVSRST